MYVLITVWLVDNKRKSSERCEVMLLVFSVENYRSIKEEQTLSMVASALTGHEEDNLFKSIIFDCVKEFPDWKNVSNEQDIDIYFADLGTPSQRALNENPNGLLRKNELPKEMDFRTVTQEFISIISARRNSVPRRSLNYQTPIECFAEHAGNEVLSRLI